MRLSEAVEYNIKNGLHSIVWVKHKSDLLHILVTDVGNIVSSEVKWYSFYNTKISSSTTFNHRRDFDDESTRVVTNLFELKWEFLREGFIPLPGVNLWNINKELEEKVTYLGDTNIFKLIQVNNLDGSSLEGVLYGMNLDKKVFYFLQPNRQLVKETITDGCTIIPCRRLKYLDKFNPFNLRLDISNKSYCPIDNSTYLSLDGKHLPISSRLIGKKVGFYEFDTNDYDYHYVTGVISDIREFRKNDLIFSMGTKLYSSEEMYLLHELGK